MTMDNDASLRLHNVDNTGLQRAQRRQGIEGLGRAQTTRHVVWAQARFFFLLILSFTNLCVYVYYYDALRYDGGRVWQEPGPNNATHRLGLGMFFCYLFIKFVTNYYYY